MMHGGFEVFVKEQNGAICKIIDIDKSDTIDKVKQMASDKFGIDKWRFRLNYGTKILKDDLTVGDYNIEKDSTLRMMFT
jgi:ubiquitin C